MTELNRTIDVSFQYVDVRDNVVGQVCSCQNKQDIDVSVEDVNISLDIIQYDPNNAEMQIIIGQMIKGDKGDPGYTPQRGVDYWTQEDIDTIDQHIANYIDQRMLYWEPM